MCISSQVTFAAKFLPQTSRQSDGNQNFPKTAEPCSRHPTTCKLVFRKTLLKIFTKTILSCICVEENKHNNRKKHNFCKNFSFPIFGGLPRFGIS